MPAYPEMFKLFFLLVPVVILMFFQFLWGRKSIMNFSGLWRNDDYYELYTVKWFFSSAGMIIFLVFTILALAGYPDRGVPVSYEPDGTDIIFVVDVSRSMNAEDITPSRLDMSSRLIRSVCENTPGGRFGLVVYKGQGIKMIPSTEDVESVYSFLNYIDTDLISSPGSNIESGLETALDAFPGGEERRKYIFLFSDGEALGGELDEVLIRASDEDVVVYTIGAGTLEGSEIPLSDGSLVTNLSGDIVISRLDRETLEYIADATGGEYFDISDNGLLPGLIRIAGADESTSDEDGYRMVVGERYRLFLLFALAGLLLSRMIKVVRWKKNY